MGGTRLVIIFVSDLGKVIIFVSDLENVIIFVSDFVPGNNTPSVDIGIANGNVKLLISLSNLLSKTY